MICNSDKNYKYETDIPTISKPIQIKRVDSYESKSNNNNFDPSKSSPPNEFMMKLYKRMQDYKKPDIFSEK